MFQDRMVDLPRRADSFQKSSELRPCRETQMPGVRTEPQN
jgi:hypothetical protein